MYVRRHESFQSWVVSTQQSSGYLMLPTEGNAEVTCALFYRNRRVGDRHLENAPVCLTLIETTDQKHHGLSFSGCSRGSPLAFKELTSLLANSSTDRLISFASSVSNSGR